MTNSGSWPPIRAVAILMPTCISTHPTATVSTPYTVTSAVLPVSVAQNNASATGSVASANAPSTTQSSSAAIIPCPTRRWRTDCPIQDRDRHQRRLHDRRPRPREQRADADAETGDEEPATRQ